MKREFLACDFDNKQILCNILVSLEVKLILELNVNLPETGKCLGSLTFRYKRVTVVVVRLRNGMTVERE
jgi:hypothetical protein